MHKQVYLFTLHSRLLIMSFDFIYKHLVKHFELLILQALFTYTIISPRFALVYVRPVVSESCIFRRVFWLSSGMGHLSPRVT